MRHFLSLNDVTRDEMAALLEEAARLKKAVARRQRLDALHGRVLGLIFEKPSLRTRVSFETAMIRLGGSAIFLQGQEAGLGTRETVPDFARTLSQYVDVVALRVFKQATVEEFAEHATVPIVNALSDLEHPCQALGDLLTMQEVLPDLKERTLVFIGDGNNVARSLAVGCGKLGIRFVLAAPEGYGFDKSFLASLKQVAPKADVLLNGNPAKAVQHADILYTDVWTSMGQEKERKQRLKHFAKHQINEALLAKAPRHARIMHCLPAHRGEEITAEVIDGKQSVAFQQAGNRLYVQMALLGWLLGK